MKQTLLLVSIAVAALCSTEAIRVRRDNDDKYTTKYDNLNLDDILASDRLVNNYFKCIMDTGKCTTDGAELRSHIEESLQEGCKKCSDAQRAGSDKVIKFFHDKRPEMFKQLQNKYDPDHKYYKNYEHLFKDSPTP